MMITDKTTATPPISKKYVKGSNPSTTENILPINASVDTIMDTLLGDANFWQIVCIE